MRNALVKLLICSLLTLSFVTVTVHQANAADKHPLSTIPKLSKINQISPNQLQVTYDQPVDMVKGLDPKNYWIQSTMEETPSGIATLGKNDSVNNTNSLTAAVVSIKPMGNKGQTFILTFNQNITKGMAFKMIICYVTKPNSPPYSGDNGSANFVGY